MGSLAIISSGDSSTYFCMWREMLMQVILSLFFSRKPRTSSSVSPGYTGSVVLMNTRCVVGILSSMTWRESRLAMGSPPVNTKSQYGVILSMRSMLLQIFLRLKPRMSAYSGLFMQNGQLLRQS